MRKEGKACAELRWRLMEGKLRLKSWPSMQDRAFAIRELAVADVVAQARTGTK